MHLHLFPLFLILLFMFMVPVPRVVCEANQQFVSCGAQYECGNMNISYPFWGGSRPPYCGHPGFELTCNGEAPVFTMKEASYRILDINNSFHTLTVARADYWDSYCPPTYVNTTLNESIFSYNATYTDVTLYYDCPQLTIAPSNQFNCTNITGYYTTLDFNLGVSIGSCSVYVTVPIFKSAATAIVSGGGTLTLLTEALKGGFGLEWNASNSLCTECVESGGQCGYTSNQFTCYCRNGYSPSTCQNTTSASGTGGNNVPKTVGYSVLGAVLLGIFLGCLFYFLAQRRRRASKAKSKDLPTPPSSKGIAPSLTGFSESIPSYPYTKSDIEKGSTYFGVQVFSYMELEEATNNFDPSRELGDGGFGTVYYGKLQDGRVVAVKRLYENNFKRVEQFMNEVQILTRLQHQNLVKLYGCTSRRSRELLLVYEYIPNGTVADHLHGKQANSGSITWPVRLSIAIETANALAYLHESEIIHRDVKTNNILLDNNFQVKVADFGLSRLFPTDVTHVSTAPQGTPGYVDPEYHQCYQLTSKSDVYSFGVVLMELISSKQAVDTNRHRHDINLANMAVNKILNHTLHELVDPSLGFESDSLVRRKITLVAELAFRCLQHERDMRPTMGEVLKALRRIENEESDVQKAEEVDINSEDIGLLKSNPPPVSPDSVVADKGVNPTTPYSF
ncbi:LEAF RUST 10 DISEASE-RESISTANCE LOCUS RECEPTOR-LIKE PROTEIN KINASE-like 1.4 isoform X4 [Vitis vinifera]|uniref:LEAF RUST 10 DISEASE-RESISTANCE LOCUS RECEPTOR-LIKE PROTEIN KINASE-like 1.4 isoform X4 n=1 Tax=Vitis vinifera TaxID=29760 RepID=UPI00053FAE4E|nr:LEAF RUST 10 DISEASE-RESISTANCE LOCUS RECEPTOR-LIKE PROTEIN KINASE-like 1.4 isoform X4 [Vitis vinifera]|eukprot:XP_010660405.1 PREDICTED: LEAF RUST 10 DISEASE-RESISTANCE LOCUS RECEPTOR-LIKE PROTEIN KINASE-like 1.4 isoform X4 [Vitis vinifera]